MQMPQQVTALLPLQALGEVLRGLQENSAAVTTRLGVTWAPLQRT
jgi:hypothetical protein